MTPPSSDVCWLEREEAGTAAEMRAEGSLLTERPLCSKHAAYGISFNPHDNLKIET